MTDLKFIDTNPPLTRENLMALHAHLARVKEFMVLYSTDSVELNDALNEAYRPLKTLSAAVARELLTTLPGDK